MQYCISSNSLSKSTEYYSSMGFTPNILHECILYSSLDRKLDLGWREILHLA